MERATGILTNFLFVLFDKCSNCPENAARYTTEAIKKSIELLYPKENNHFEIRREWIIKYCEFLMYLLYELSEDNINLKKPKRKL